METALNPESIFRGASYFHGRLFPEHANFRLNRRGGFDGLFLIYEDAGTAGKYILAICSENRIRTYYLGVSADGHITYGDGVTVPLMHRHDLVHYHLQKCKAFHVRPLVPCLRPNENDDRPIAWQTVTMEELETRMLLAAGSTQNKSIENLVDVLGSQRRKFLLRVARELPALQPWYHGSIDRDEAERRLDADERKQSGTFLVREKEGGMFALSMRYKNRFCHYTINQVGTDEGATFSLDDEPVFYNIMDIIEHYSTKPKSFVLALSSPCIRPGYKKPDLPLLDLKAKEALENYDSETRHLQNPEFDIFIMSRLEQSRQPISGTEKTGNIITEVRTTVQVKSQQQQGQEDNDDAKLDEFIASALPFDDHFLVSKIEVQNCTIKLDK